MKDRQWKDYWDVELGVSYIPHEKLDAGVNLVELEEGGTFDEDTIPDWIRTMRGAPMGMTVAPSAAGLPTPVVLPDMNKLSGAPPPGFVRIPEGMSPAMGQGDPAHIPVPGGPPGPPPGLPPFGLPPSLAQAGLLPGPAVLPGAGLLGAPGTPRLVAPPGILLPRFGLPQQPPPLSGHPPPGFPPPTFDISQPPPGLRPPFASFGLAAAAAGAPVVSEAGSDDMDIEMEIERPSQPVVAHDRFRGGSDRRERGNRESRWNRDEKPSDGENNESLASRLRSLAGHDADEGRKPAEVWEGGAAPSRGKSHILKKIFITDCRSLLAFSTRPQKLKADAIKLCFSFVLVRTLL